jgi:hypothetical protein
MWTHQLFSIRKRAAIVIPLLSLTPNRPILGRAFLLSFALFAAPAFSQSAKYDSDQPVLPSFSARAEREIDIRPEGMPSDDALKENEAVIGRIIINPNEIFDTRISAENTRLFRLANRLHYGTRVATVEDKLLFETGETFDPKIIAESERLLRDTRYLYDAQIRPVAYDNNVVDLEVQTRDVWTLNPGVSFGRKGGENSSGFELEELNLLGLGTQLSLKHTSDVDRDSTSLRYVDGQLGRSWWRIETEYADNSDGQRQRLILEQPFYALDTRRSAGISLVDEERIDNFYDAGEEVYEFGRQRRFAEIKWGWSSGRATRFIDRFSVGWTFDNQSFSDVGSVPSDLLPSDRKLSYPWFSWERLEDRYLEGRNLDQIERTEDVSLGWRFFTRIGLARSDWAADRNAFLLASSVSKGYEWSRGRQLQWQTALTSRYERGQFVDTLLSGRIQYYRRQSDRRLFFAALEWDAGHKLDQDQQLSLGGDSGLRGYPLRFSDGEGRWLFTVEQRAFSNWYPFRLVHVGAAAFIDVGSTWGRSRFESEQRVLSNFGLGLRLGNSRSALGNVLHMDLAMPLGGSGSVKDLQFIVETKKSF